MMKSIKWKEFETVRSMQENQKIIYQVSITWYRGKATLKKKTPESF